MVRFHKTFLLVSFLVLPLVATAFVATSHPTRIAKNGPSWAEANHKKPPVVTTRYNTITNLVPQEIIEFGVSFDTFAPQFLWLPMIVAPNSDLTKKIMGGTNGITAIVVLALVHLGIVVTAASQDGALDQIQIFGEVFDPKNSQLVGMQKLFQYPNFVAEEWPHVLIWDLFVGRMIWLDGLQRGVNTRVALAFCNGIGPPGFLIYVVTCLLSGKGLPSMDNVTTADTGEDK